MTNEYNINNIYNILSNYNIDKNFIKSILLPEWWDDQIANSKAGYLQTVSIIAKNLGIEIKDILESKNILNPKHNYKI